MVKQNLITFVCTANICRSPMAEALLRHALQVEQEPLRSIQIASAGVFGTLGEPASQNAIRALKNVSLDLGQHKSCPVNADLMNRSLAIFTMTQTHRSLLEVRYPEALHRLSLMRGLMGEGGSLDIPDPFGQSLSAYEASRDSMVEAIPSILKWLRQHCPPS